MHLGKDLDEIQRGKASVPGVRATQHANKDQYYPHAENAKVPDTSNRIAFTNYSAEEIKNSNKLDVLTLKNEAKQFFSDQP